MSGLRGSASVLVLASATVVSLAVATASRLTHPSKAEVRTTAPANAKDIVERGRFVVVSHDCGGCHGGGSDPSAKGWLAGITTPDDEFLVGACRVKPGATPCFRTRPRNLTPDNMTGLGRFSERQIYNSLRYGLRPEDTPDVEITSSTPGSGNFPAQPHYLAPPMPWPSWRHLPDEDLQAIAAYLKRGVKAVRNKVPDSEGPPDFWASKYTVEEIGRYPAPPFPTVNEQLPVAARQP